MRTFLPTLLIFLRCAFGSAARKPLANAAALTSDLKLRVLQLLAVPFALDLEDLLFADMIYNL
jgi:hypothetical protein